MCQPNEKIRLSHEEINRHEGKLEALLDDVAALMIQIEPDCRSDLIQLRDSLNTIVNDVVCSETRREKITQAAQKIDEILEGQATEPNQVFSVVGKLIEEAMFGRDGGKSTQDILAEEALKKRPDSMVLEDYMPKDPDMDLLREYIAESSDLIAKAEEALLML